MINSHGFISLLMAIFICGASPHAQSPGAVIGTTNIENQSFGSMGNKIAVDQNGGIHAVWMKGIGGIRPRYVYYNFRSEIDSTWAHNPDGTPISGVNGTGYVTLDLLAGGETIAAYHSSDATPAHSVFAVDAFRGFGIFTEFDVNPSSEYFYPQIARNVNSGRLHVIVASIESSPVLHYAYSTDNGQIWSDYTLVHTADLYAHIIVASPISDKTAILYCKQSYAGAYYNVFYIESSDGVNWDFNSHVNVSGYIVADSLSAWGDIDAVYDYNDEIHIIYQAAMVREGAISLGSTQLRHWSPNTGYSIVTTGSENGCAQNADCLCVAKPNLGVDPYNNVIFAVWSEMDSNDVSAGGYSNGELYGAYYHQYGNYWSPKVNITNSATPGCIPGECDCDVWVSMAEQVDYSTLHILYIDDGDAGAASYGQGTVTDNAVKYLSFNLGLTSAEDPVANAPSRFSLLRAYPNPFNAKTTIEFALAEPGGVELAIYDITGAKVETIRRLGLEAGRHSIVWDAKDSASGVYFARMESGGRSKSIKIVLLK
jgi:hypothetical protein